MKDRAGRHYLKLSDAKVGDKIELDGGFACCRSGPTELYLAPDGLFFYCDNGRHYLSSQATDGIHCTGVYPVEKEQLGQSASLPTLSGSDRTHPGSAGSLIVEAEPNRASHYS